MSASVTRKSERKKRSWGYWEISGNCGATLRLMFIITPLLRILNERAARKYPPGLKLDHD
ncbi:hypothetical protein ALC56_12340 [Trachymyrmex septentrionalis]|uniref:Uncharacterized protein n=1 Tax=Trachymyrmex septentrionalis TaxID=34720 RepID=A0A195EZI5_9HYME|nr:hypothetical protein ALC56_12340 [Trachymyrmex septentrionalis]